MGRIARGWSPRVAATTLAIGLAVAGTTALVAGYANRPTPPPVPTADAAGSIAPTPSPPTTSAARPSPAATRPAAPAAPSPAARLRGVPVAISIPSIGVSSPLVDLGLNPDRSVEVPTSFHVAGWYEYGVEPGENGPSVYLGHVDSASGPGVFYRLGDLRPGDRVTIQRADRALVTYVITGVRQYPKTSFPTLDVYADTPTPTIRLVTCGGTFDSATRHYLSNIVAYGRLA